MAVVYYLAMVSSTATPNGDTDMRTDTEQQAVVNLEAVKRAWKALRKAGVVAHVASAGCRCCYCADSDQAERDPKAWGSCHLWRQDLDGPGDGAFVYYSAVEGRGRTDVEVGQAIVAALTAQGVRSKWDGDGTSAIWVEGDVPPSTDGAYEALDVATRAIYAARDQADAGCRALGLYVLGVATPTPRSVYRDHARDLDTARAALLLAVSEQVRGYYAHLGQRVAACCAEMVTLADRLRAVADYQVGDKA